MQCKLEYQRADFKLIMNNQVYIDAQKFHKYFFDLDPLRKKIDATLLAECENIQSNHSATILDYNSLILSHKERPEPIWS